MFHLALRCFPPPLHCGLQKSSEGGAISRDEEQRRQNGKPGSKQAERKRRQVSTTNKTNRKEKLDKLSAHSKIFLRAHAVRERLTEIELGVQITLRTRGKLRGSAKPTQDSFKNATRAIESQARQVKRRSMRNKTRAKDEANTSADECMARHEGIVENMQHRVCRSSNERILPAQQPSCTCIARNKSARMLGEVASAKSPGDGSCWIFWCALASCEMPSETELEKQRERQVN